MSGPLSGLGQQQVSYTQASQQSVANDQARTVRDEKQVPEGNKIQARGAALAQSGESNKNNVDTFKENLANIKDPSEAKQQQPRGSVVDLVV